MTRVFVLADSPEAAESLVTLIADDSRLEVAGASCIARFQQRELEESRAEVVLVSRVDRKRLDRVSVPIVLLTDAGEDHWRLSGNVKAHLPVHATPAEAFAALIAVAQGLTVLTPAQAESMLNVDPATTDERDLPVERLTQRESEVLRMMGQGAANKEIANELHIAENTVKFHVTSILGKLNATSRTEAVARGLRIGLIPI